MSTNIANPTELAALYRRAGVRPAPDGAGYIFEPRPASAGYEPAPAVADKLPVPLLRGRAAVARQPHKLEVAGSTPAPATNFKEAA
jgi:hypothetical protein